MDSLHTSRLKLRPFRDSDLEALHLIFSDAETMRYWDRPAHDTLAQTRETLDKLMRDAPDRHLEYAIEHDGALVGRVGMWKRYEIGYILRRDLWGQGLMSEALSALLTEMERRFPEAERFSAEIDPRNAASARLLEKLGFTLDRVGEKDFLYGGTEWIDTGYYSRPGPMLDKRA